MSASALQLDHLKAPGPEAAMDDIIFLPSGHEFPTESWFIPNLFINLTFILVLIYIRTYELCYTIVMCLIILCTKTINACLNCKTTMFADLNVLVIYYWRISRNTGKYRRIPKITE